MDEKNITQPLFLAHFTDGYTFRNMIEYLKSTNTKGNFIFNKDGITFTEEGMERKLLNRIEIRASDISYVYNATEPQIIYGANLSELRILTKSIAKKDTLDIFMFPDDMRLFILPRGLKNNNGDRQNIVHIVHQNIPLVKYEPHVYKRDLTNPNCTVSAKSFCGMCTNISTQKLPFVDIKGDVKSVNFCGVNASGVYGGLDRFGASSSKDTSLINEVMTTSTGMHICIVNQKEDAKLRVKGNIFKSLVKLNNLSTEGNLRMYIEDASPLKIICNIGNYGILTVYLRT